MYPGLSRREYTGYWLGHVMQGQGIYSDSEAVKTGTFKGSRLDGKGLYSEVNGAIALKGEFQADLLNGVTC